MKRAFAALATITVIAVAVPSPAHALPAGVAVWFHPGGDQFTPSSIWRFDAASRTGWRRSFIPSLTAFPVQNQYTFVFRTVGRTDHLRWTVSGGTSRITTVGHNPAADIMSVNYDGYVQTWYGCRSAGRPAYAQAACW